MGRAANTRSGYSLAEVLIASALSGVVLVAAMDGMSGSARTWMAAGDAADAEALAHDLLAEVLSQAYSDPDTTNDPTLNAFGPESDERADDRSTFDDLDDYDDWSESPPQTRDGAVIDAYGGWSRTVVVQKLKKKQVDGFRSDGEDDHESRHIAVTVTDTEGASHTVEAIRARVGGMEQSLGVTVEAVTGVAVTLEAGGADSVYGATRLLNHAEGP